MTQTNPPSLDTQAKLTPMMEQYRSIKKTLSPDTVLFFRLGDFYEMFFEDAVRASDILNMPFILLSLNSCYIKDISLSCLFNLDG